LTSGQCSSFDNKYIPFYNQFSEWIGPIESEAWMSTTELIENAGYPSETHHVTTEDGYILELHRIPRGYGQTDRTADTKPRIPILITNYLIFATSSCWVWNQRNQSLGFILSDAGYDVWLGNYRGGLYSTNHTTLDVDSREFWRFGYDEMAVDVAAMIDYVIETTGHKKIYLSSAVMGSVPPVMLLADRPEYNDKVHASLVVSSSIGMGVWIMPYIFRIPSQLINPLVSYLFERLQVGEAKLDKPLLRAVGPVIGKILSRANDMLNFAPYAISFATLGFQVHNINASRLPVFLGHAPTAFSMQVVMHLNQLFAYGTAIKYDYGAKENVERYGQPSPPYYNLSQITTPTLIAYARNDVVSRQGEAEYLGSQVQNATLFEINSDEWSHFHVIFASNGKEAIFDRMIAHMKKLEGSQS
jgi:lysosomal acid lipase/cholesteryl ester hydrolase